ncbi:MAG: RNA polymerase sigma factor, partial [Acidimicrobiales bacterium]
NCCATLLDRRERAPHMTLDTVKPPEAEARLGDLRSEHDPEARSAVLAERDRLAAALAELPPRLRAVVVLRDIYDLPHDAIASELGITATTSKVRLHRARRQLRDRLFPEKTRIAEPAPVTGIADPAPVTGIDVTGDARVIEPARIDEAAADPGIARAM